MWTRRQMLRYGGLGLTGITCAATAATADKGSSERTDALPDGSASKGMISTEAEQAIERGLTFLASKARNGSFGTNSYLGNTAVCSLAGLAFLASGSLPNRGRFGKVLTETIKFVLSQENREGRFPGFLHNPDATPHGPMYGHGFATLFLGEIYGLVHEPRLRKDIHDKLDNAVKLIVKSQNNEGGWRYRPDTREADLSVTICQIMALRSARNAGFAVPKETVEQCVKYVKRCQDRRGGWFRYMASVGGGPQQAFARTAAGVSALYSAGIYKGPEVEAGLRYLMTCKPTGQSPPRPDMTYFYGHYYAAQAMWTAGGDYWKEWFPAIRDELLGSQMREGYWWDRICYHYATAMALIILQIPNNYLPILQK